jgi:hypothetical protein
LNAVDAVYSVTGRVTLDVEGNVVTLTFSNFVLTPPAGFIKPAGYPGPTTSFTIGQFSGQATRTPGGNLTEPWYTDGGGENIADINPILPGIVGRGPTIRVNGVLIGPVSNGTMNLIIVASGVDVEISTTFIAVATR